jgi:hypothetical protein
MRVGGKRRIVVPPKLGPPIGPSTFFSAKQCEVRPRKQGLCGPLQPIAPVRPACKHKNRPAMVPAPGV